ncbi:TRAP transporter substrate-binding protein DctP [Marinivivus vitaminiproducens]|uniref:TRAP transporter substrate-binding protein DctP n=1 Tax=Marinivivus vitaminiproducens TaxID=3035935 RepID=UPI0027A8F638|nr:TRAP transporter substrate-binding protein DctP [Geminicoccaceae bacterium SCSIO 64248]
MLNAVRWTSVVLALGTLAHAGDASAVTLRASHQWPGGQGDVRDEMVQMMARQVEEAGVDLTIRIYPGASLFKPVQQWDALVRGQLDISAFPLDYASGSHPQFSATLMPGLVKNHDHARRLNDSAFMEDIKQIMLEDGVMVLADAWLAGGFVSKEKCILAPDDIQGQVTRAAGPAFEQMLAAAGASISAMPSSEIYTGLQTGVLDAANTSSASFVSFRIYEQVTCLTPPGDHAIWFMYEPVVMAKESFDELDEAQQQALLSAGQAAEDYFFEAAKGIDDELIEAFNAANVEVATMGQAEYDAWLEVAKASAYANFSKEVPGGAELLEKALAVE